MNQKDVLYKYMYVSKTIKCNVMHTNNEADGYRYMYCESQEAHGPLQSPGNNEHWNWQNGGFKIKWLCKTYLIKSKIHIVRIIAFY